MRCPVCSHPVTKVRDSRPKVTSDDKAYTWRRRECMRRDCHHQWETEEHDADDPETPNRW